TKYLLPLGRLGGLVPHEGRRHSLEPGAGDDRPSIGTVQGDAEFVGVALLSEPDGDPPLRFQEDAGPVQALGTQLSERAFATPGRARDVDLPPVVVLGPTPQCVT